MLWVLRAILKLAELFKVTTTIFRACSFVLSSITSYIPDSLARRRHSKEHVSIRAVENILSIDNAFVWLESYGKVALQEQVGAQPALHFGGGNLHEISFDDVIGLIQPWYNVLRKRSQTKFSSQYSENVLSRCSPNDQDRVEISSLIQTPGSALS